jgi:hypothetical protein
MDAGWSCRAAHSLKKDLQLLLDQLRLKLPKQPEPRITAAQTPQKQTAASAVL